MIPQNIETAGKRLARHNLLTVSRIGQGDGIEVYGIDVDRDGIIISLTVRLQPDPHCGCVTYLKGGLCGHALAVAATYYQR